MLQLHLCVISAAASDPHHTAYVTNSAPAEETLPESGPRALAETAGCSDCLSSQCNLGNGPSDLLHNYGNDDPTFNNLCRQGASSMRSSNECAFCPSCLEHLDRLEQVTDCRSYDTYGTEACNALEVCIRGDDRGPPCPSSQACEFSRNDRDGDCMFTRAEMVARTSEQAASRSWQGMLDQIDSNNDGAISPEEWTSHDPIQISLSQYRHDTVRPGTCDLAGCHNGRPCYTCSSDLWVFWGGSYWVIGRTLGDEDSRVLSQSDNDATPPRSGWRLSASGALTPLSVTDTLAPSPPPAPQDGCTCPEAYPTCAPDLRDAARQYQAGSIGASVAVGSATCVCRGCTSSETRFGRTVEEGGSSSNACSCQNCGEEGRAFVACGESWGTGSDDSSSSASGSSSEVTDILAPSSPPPAPHQDGFSNSSGSSSSASGSSSEDYWVNIVVIGTTIGGIVSSGIVVGLVACISSLKCHAIFVLVLSILTLLVSVTSAFTLIGIPAAIITIITSLLAIAGSSLIACESFKKTDGSPSGYIACGVLCLLSFILRLAALVVSVIVSAASLIVPKVGFIIALVVIFCIVLTVASGLAEILLSSRCFCCPRKNPGAGTGETRNSSPGGVQVHTI
jgi:hypothetical protein